MSNRVRRYRLSEAEEQALFEARENGQVPDFDVVSNDIDKYKTAVEIKNLRTKYAEVLKQLTDTKQRLEDAVQLKNTPSSGMKPFKPTKRRRHDSTAVVLASDWHVMERVDADMLGGMNEFNPAIAEQRAANFAEGVADHFTHVASRYGTSDMVIFLLGDFISGYIHEELMESNYGSPIEEIVLAQGLLSNSLDFILKETEIDRLTIICKPGNHGRTTQKIHHSTFDRNSYEVLMYQHLAEQYKGDNRVSFVVEPGLHSYVLLHDEFLIRAHHGHAIRYSGGIGGISIPANRAIGEWNIQKKANLDVFGHYHSYLDGQRFLSNGSLIGYGPFALQLKASFDAPKQTFALIRKGYGKDMVAPIFV